MVENNGVIFKKHREAFDKTLEQYRESVLEVFRSESELESKVMRLEPLILIIDTLVKSRGSSEYFQKSRVFLIALDNNAWNKKNIGLGVDTRAKINRYRLLVKWYSDQILEMQDLSLHNDFSRVEFNAEDKT